MLVGDPAFDGIEVQMADFRYNPGARGPELTGRLYRAAAPRRGSATRGSPNCRDLPHRRLYCT